MDPRMGRRFGFHQHEEPAIISPHAARLHGGSLSGPRRQGYGPGSGGAGPPSRAGPSGRARQDSEDILDNEEVETPRRAYAGGHSRHDAEEASFTNARPSAHRHDNVTGHFRHDAEEASFTEARPSARRHDNVSGRPNRDERDREYEHSGAFSDRRTPARGSRLNHLEDCQLDHEDVDALGAVGARPGRRNPIHQGQGDIRRVRETSEDNERYGESRRGGGYGNPEPGALVGGRGMRRDEKQAYQFVPCTFAKLHPRLVNLLVENIRVTTSKVKEWCEKDYIYVDAKRTNNLDIRRLLSKLTSKEQERFRNALSRNPDVNWSARHTPGWSYAV